MVTINGSSPLTVRGLDPGMIYSIKINMFDGNQVVLRGRAVTEIITVVNTTSSKICDCIAKSYIATGYLQTTHHVYGIAYL